MSENLETIKEQLRKIQRLAESGVGGDRETAKAMLAKLLKRHKLTEAALTVVEKSLCKFSCSGEENLTLLVQCCAKVTNPKDGIRYRRVRKDVYLELTPLEFAETNQLYNYYKKAWAKEKEMLLRAYVQRYGLFRESNGEGESTLSLKEIEEMFQWMRGFRTVPYAKPCAQLEF